MPVITAITDRTIAPIQRRERGETPNGLHPEKIGTLAGKIHRYINVSSTLFSRCVHRRILDFVFFPRQRRENN